MPALLYALVATDCDYAVELFRTRSAAERALAEVIADEPGFAAIMTVQIWAALPPPAPTRN